jgi:hypothetical protein
LSDIATLGLTIDSSQAVTATAALNSLAAAAGPAASGVSQLEKAASGVSGTMAGAGRSVSQMERLLGSLDKELTKNVNDQNLHNVAMRNGTVAVDALAKMHGSLSTQAMAAGHSIRSAIEQVALGVPPTTILTQQLNHLSYAASGPGGLKGAFGEAVGALRSLISPTALVVGGLALAAAGAYFAYSAWKTYALQLDDTAKRANTTTAELSKLQAAAAFKGISGDDFTKGISKFSDDVYLATKGLGGLAEVFRANGVPAARDFNDALGKASDLIQKTGTDQQKLVLLQQMGLPPTMEWVRLLSSGAAGLEKAKAAAVEFGGVVNDEMVRRAREFDDTWNKFWTNFGLRARNGGLGVVLTISAMTDAINAKISALMANPAMAAYVKLLELSYRAGGALAGAAGYGAPAPSAGPTPNSRVSDAFSGGFPQNPSVASALNAKANQLNGVVDVETQKKLIALDQQRIGLLGPLITLKDAARAKENELTLAYIGGVKGLDQYKTSLINLAVYQAESTKLSQAASYGIFNSARQYANAVREIDVLKASGVIKNADDYAAAWVVITKRIKEAADAATVARSALEQTTRYGIDSTNTMKQFDGLAVSSFGNIENSLSSAITRTKDWKTAFSDLTSSVLADISKMGVRMAITGPLAKMLGGAVGGGGADGSTFMPSTSFMDHGFGYHSGGTGIEEASFKRYVHPAYFDDAPRFHSGIGPNEIPAIIKNDESVLTKGQMAAIGKGMSAPGSSGPVTVNVINAPAGTTATSTATPTPGGGVQIDVMLSRMIDDTVAGHISSGQSAINSTLERRYPGMTPRL